MITSARAKVDLRRRLAELARGAAQRCREAGRNSNRAPLTGASPSGQVQPVPVGRLATSELANVANGPRSARQDAGAGPFIIPVVQAFTGRRRGVAVIAPPLVGWRWALGPRSSHAGVPDRIGGVIGALRDVLSFQRVVLELRNRPDARLAAPEEDQH